MAQNIYDDPGFFAGYSRLPRSVQGLDGTPEWPAVRRVLPDLAGRRVVDLGCGFGWFCRWAREHGAARVVGYDLSENMIGRARRDTAGAGIEYGIADLEDLDLPASAFDFAYSSLALHYIVDLDRLIRTVHRALTPGSHFVFTIEHPIYTAVAPQGWARDEQGRKTWPIQSYALEGPRVTDWLAQGVVKQHRTLGTIVNGLIRAGFEIRHLQEWSPTPQELAANPELATEVERPTVLAVSARR